ncbi:unnamed protein product [Urochloa humidicola]
MLLARLELTLKISSAPGYFFEALRSADEKQKDSLFENCGKSDPSCVAQVKPLYKELDLERAFSEYESRVTKN